MNGAEMFIAEEAEGAEIWGQKNEFPSDFSAPMFLP